MVGCFHPDIFTFLYIFFYLFIFTSFFIYLFYHVTTIWSHSKFFHGNNQAAFPGKSQLRQSRATQTTVYAGCFGVSIFHRTLTWTSAGSLTCAQMSDVKARDCTLWCTDYMIFNLRGHSLSAVNL